MQWKDEGVEGGKGYIPAFFIAGIFQIGLAIFFVSVRLFVPYSYEIPIWGDVVLIVVVLLLLFVGITNIVQTLSLRKVTYAVETDDEGITITTYSSKMFRFSYNDIEAVEVFYLEGWRKYIYGCYPRMEHYMLKFKNGTQIMLPGSVTQLDELIYRLNQSPNVKAQDMGSE